jgi:uncharacterized protein (TIGR02246 family)
MAADEDQIQLLYRTLIDAWNDRDAERFAAVFLDDGASIGFDGSELEGRHGIQAELRAIFAEHETAPYIVKVRSVELLAQNVGLLRAVAGMVPVGQTDIDPKVNAHHTLLAVRPRDGWLIKLFQNTPAQFHGRPELAEKLTQELSELL